MPRVIQEGVPARVQINVDLEHAVPPYVKDHRFVAKGQVTSYLSWSVALQKMAIDALKDRVAKFNTELSAKGGTAGDPLTDFGAAFKMFVTEAGGTVGADGAVSVEGIRNAYKFDSFVFRRHSYTIVLVVPHEFADCLHNNQGGLMTNRVALTLDGMWAQIPIWLQDVKPSKQEFAAKIKSRLSTNHPVTQADIDRIYKELPPGRYAVHFFLPTYYRKRLVDAGQEINRLGAFLNVGTFFVMASASKLAEYPILKTQTENTIQIADEMSRKLEELKAENSQLQMDKHTLQVILAQKGRPIQLAPPSSMQPALPPAWHGGPESEVGGFGLPKRKWNLHLKTVIPLLIILAGGLLAAYGLTLHAPASASAAQQAALASQAALMAAGGAILCVATLGVWGFMSRGKTKPRPEDIQPRGAVPQ